jgi:hypothetical protein
VTLTRALVSWAGVTVSEAVAAGALGRCGGAAPTDVDGLEAQLFRRLTDPPRFPTLAETSPTGMFLPPVAGIVMSCRFGLTRFSPSSAFGIIEKRSARCPARWLRRIAARRAMTRSEARE